VLTYGRTLSHFGSGVEVDEDDDGEEEDSEDGERHGEGALLVLHELLLPLLLLARRLLHLPLQLAHDGGGCLADGLVFGGPVTG